VQGLLQTVVSMANTSFEGSYVFGGTASASAPFVPASLTYTSSQGSGSAPLSASTALSPGAVTSISDAATQQTFTFTASAGDTIATLEQAVGNAVSAGTLAAGISASIGAGGQLTIGQTTGAGLVVSTDDAALGEMTAGAAVSDSYAYVGNAEVNHVSVGNSQAVASNVPGSTLFGAGSNVVASLSGLIQALQTGSTDGIASATNAVTAALSSFSTQRVPLDTSLNHLNAQESYLSQETLTLTSQQDDLTGISTAVAATNLSQAELTNNAILAAAAKALPQTLLQYLQ
jgi:flagellar hook-associated protein 3 FlgL